MTTLSTHGLDDPDQLRHVCDHGEALWVTGPDPARLLAEFGCPCDEGRAA